MHTFAKCSTFSGRSRRQPAPHARRAAGPRRLRASRISAEEKRRIEDAAVRARRQDAGGRRDCRARPTASIAAPPGTWTSSTRLAASPRSQDNLKVQFHNEKGDIEFTPAAMRVTGKLKLQTCIFGEDFSYLQVGHDQATPKLTIPSPSMVHYRGGRAAIDPRSIPSHGGVLARPVAGLCRRDRSARQAWLHLPAAR